MFNLNIFGREDLTPIRKLLIMHAIAGGTPLNEYEIEGNPASFLTNIAKPLSGLEIPFLPFQEGTGDPSPENVRPISGWTGVNIGHTGENLLGGIAIANAIVSSMPSATINESEHRVSFAANASADHVISGLQNNTWSRYQYVFKENTQYTFFMTFMKNSGATGSSNLKIAYMDDTSDIIPMSDTPYTKTTVVFTSDSGKTIRAFYKSNSSGTTYLYYNESGIFEGDLTEQDFEEWVGTVYPVTFPALGKNLLPGMETGAINQSTGQDETDNTAMRCVGYIPVEPGETYTLGTLASSGNIRFFGYDEDKNYLGNAVVRNVTNATYTVGSGTYFIRFQGATERFTGVDLQFEKGESHTAYEPFTNTVYGGTLDAVNGVLTVEWELFDLGELDWTYADTANYRLWYAYNAEMDADNTDLLCEQYRPSTDNANNNTIRKYKTGSGAKRVSVHDDRYNEYSIEQFKTAMDGVYIAAKIATPYEIHLDPITVQTLIGDNTIWTDTNGSNTIKYKKKG